MFLFQVKVQIRKYPLVRDDGNSLIMRGLSARFDGHLRKYTNNMLTVCLLLKHQKNKNYSNTTREKELQVTRFIFSACNR